jgi:hypothetical protein
MTQSGHVRPTDALTGLTGLTVFDFHVSDTYALRLYERIFSLRAMVRVGLGLTAGSVPIAGGLVEMSRCWQRTRNVDIGRLSIGVFERSCRTC